MEMAIVVDGLDWSIVIKWCVGSQIALSVRRPRKELRSSLNYLIQ